MRIEGAVTNISRTSTDRPKTAKCNINDPFYQVRLLCESTPVQGNEKV